MISRDILCFSAFLLNDVSPTVHRPRPALESPLSMMRSLTLAGCFLLAFALCLLGPATGQAASEAELRKAAKGEKLTEDEFNSIKKALIKDGRSGRVSSQAMQELINKLREAPAVRIGPDRKSRYKVLENTLVDLRMIYEGELAGSAIPPDQLQKHPSADLFPGSIPGQVQPSTQTCEINANSYRWQSTGLYAPPGETIRVFIPDSYVDAGWKLRIGANSTTIDVPRHKTINRFPKIDRVYSLTERSIEVGSSFGGLIYIELPTPKAKTFLAKDSDIYNLIDEYTPPPKKMCQIRFTNVIQAPRYVHGETDVREWRAQIRNYPAPYAEIGSDKVIFMLPSQFIRKLDTPDLAMEKWDAVIDAMSELSGRPKTKPFPHRFLIDAHVNWGAAFASYPINAPFGWAEAVVKGEPEWGHCHELGHLHQHRAWTYQGTGEVTVNIFSHYALEQVYGRASDRGSRETVIEKTRQYLSRPLDDRNWMTVNGALFERLAFYQVLSYEFGWEPFKQVFREYRALPLDQHPRSDIDRASDFLVRMSRATNHNLGPYFTQWGVQVHDAALGEVQSLPAWESEMVQEALAN